MEREHCIYSAREHRNCTNIKIRRVDRAKEERYEIEGTVYTVTVEESDNANVTALDIIRRLVFQNTDRPSRTQGRTCCLRTDGGQKVC